MDTTILLPKKTLLMAGDSVTDSSRDRPIGIGIDSLGNGYVSCLAQLLINHKENEITIILIQYMIISIVSRTTLSQTAWGLARPSRQIS